LPCFIFWCPKSTDYVAGPAGRRSGGDRWTRMPSRHRGTAGIGMGGNQGSNGPRAARWETAPPPCDWGPSPVGRNPHRHGGGEHKWGRRSPKTLCQYQLQIYFEAYAASIYATHSAADDSAKTCEKGAQGMQWPILDGRGWARKDNRNALWIRTSRGTTHRSQH